MGVADIIFIFLPDRSRRPGAFALFVLFRAFVGKAKRFGYPSTAAYSTRRPAFRRGETGRGGPGPEGAGALPARRDLSAVGPGRARSAVLRRPQGGLCVDGARLVDDGEQPGA